MWGTWTRQRLYSGLFRFIPTNVGNMTAKPAIRTNGTVHPHECGEHCFLLSATLRPYGSSPRMWGTWQESAMQSRQRRFIPTNVGNMQVRRFLIPFLTVHPHECGEHFSIGLTTWLIFGSSPRMWGTCVLTDYSRMFTRFIPTDVGNIMAKPTQPTTKSVHPHGCGEHLVSDIVTDVRQRFIPTNVGNIQLIRASWEELTVHPHECGEHLDLESKSLGCVRFIPTNVGNIVHADTIKKNRAVHPH